MKQRAGHLAAARSLVPVCEGLRGGTFEVGESNRGREREVQEVAEGVQGSIQPAGLDAFRPRN